MNNWALFLVDDDFNIVWSSLNSIDYWYSPRLHLRREAKGRDGRALRFRDEDCTYIYVELKEE